MIEHGGDLAAATERYGIAASHWLDLSTGISPFAYPVGELARDAWRRLPSPSVALREAAEEYYGTDALEPMPGSQAAIDLLPRLIGAGSVAIEAPAYAEHERRWHDAGATITRSTEDPVDVVVVCNPNNPTGRVYSTPALLALHSRQAARGGWLVLDEAFVDTEPALSLAPHAGEPGLVVLRSFGKFFGLAGVRLGFLFAPPALLKRARDALGPWAVSGPALAIAEKALADRDFHAATRLRLKEASVRLCALLAQHEHRVAGSTDFFVWVRHPKPRAFQERLAHKGILVRAFDEPPSLRFGLPGEENEWRRLDEALAAL
ncbi:MAG: cobalamin biosynthesis protein CobC [Betaproteobacteria bacterium]|jgi:cobalamin biosynthetic protein CobC|nr:cobalamin biosynthesis protein CobC [Betaproteobacteria bacterium]